MNSVISTIYEWTESRFKEGYCRCRRQVVVTVILNSLVNTGISYPLIHDLTDQVLEDNGRGGFYYLVKNRSSNDKKHIKVLHTCFWVPFLFVMKNYQYN